MSSSQPTAIRSPAPALTTFTIPFNRFAPFGYRKFVAVGNRATAIRLSSGKVLLLNPIPLSTPVRQKLNSLGGVHFIAADLGHHLSVSEYVSAWPEAKTIGVPGLEKKRRDVKWDWIYGGEEELRERPEDVFGWDSEVESVLFEGFITRAVAWLHRPSGTLIVSDLLMNLPATEVSRRDFFLGRHVISHTDTPRKQYHPSSAAQGVLSKEFAKRAHARSVWLKRLIYYIASVDYALMRQDVKKVAEWNVVRVIPCHGDVIESRANEAWIDTHRWFLEGSARPGLLRRLAHAPFLKAVRWFFLT